MSKNNKLSQIKSFKIFNLLRKINHARLDRRTLKKLNERNKKLTEFGPKARAIYAQTNQGDFLVDPADNFVAKKLLNDGDLGKNAMGDGVHTGFLFTLD